MMRKICPLFAAFAVFVINNNLSAQQLQVIESPNGEYVTSYIYQASGSRRSRCLHMTSSSVMLPNLNAILSPVVIEPVPNQSVQPIPPVSSQTRKQTSQTGKKSSTAASSGQPRYGYGSGSAAEKFELVDPSDPSFSPNTTLKRNRIVPQTTNKGTSYNKNTEATRTQPQPRQQQPQQYTNPNPQTTAPTPLLPIYPSGSIYPFQHGYYPRTYHYSVPYSPSLGIPYHGGYSYHSYGCGIYPSRAPLRGSLTGSHNYLSGFRSLLRFSF